jgi:CheY-like chemotaxis protein
MVCIFLWIFALSFCCTTRICSGKILRRLGFEVETVNDSIEALKMVQLDPFRFDVIITDMTMPHMNGVLGRILIR